MSHPLTRAVVAGALAGALLVTLAAGGCASGPGDDSSIGPTVQLAPQWEEHGHALIYAGPGLSPGTTAWTVPTILPRGTYRVVSRRGDVTRMVDGQRVELDGNPMREVRVMLSFGMVDLYAVDERFVVGAK